MASPTPPDPPLPNPPTAPKTPGAVNENGVIRRPTFGVRDADERAKDRADRGLLRGQVMLPYSKLVANVAVADESSAPQNGGVRDRKFTPYNPNAARAETGSRSPPDPRPGASYQAPFQGPPYMAFPDADLEILHGLTTPAPIQPLHANPMNLNMAGGNSSAMGASTDDDMIDPALRTIDPTLAGSGNVSKIATGNSSAMAVSSNVEMLDPALSMIDPALRGLGIVDNNDAVPVNQQSAGPYQVHAYPHTNVQGPMMNRVDPRFPNFQQVETNEPYPVSNTSLPIVPDWMNDYKNEELLRTFTEFGLPMPVNFIRAVRHGHRQTLDGIWCIPCLGTERHELVRQEEVRFCVLDYMSTGFPCSIEEMPKYTDGYTRHRAFVPYAHNGQGVENPDDYEIRTRPRYPWPMLDDPRATDFEKRMYDREMAQNHGKEEGFDFFARPYSFHHDLAAAGRLDGIFYHDCDPVDESQSRYKCIPGPYPDPFWILHKCPFDYKSREALSPVTLPAQLASQSEESKKLYLDTHRIQQHFKKEVHDELCAREKERAELKRFEKNILWFEGDGANDPHFAALVAGNRANLRRMQLAGWYKCHDGWRKGAPTDNEQIRRVAEAHLEQFRPGGVYASQPNNTIQHLQEQVDPGQQGVDQRSDNQSGVFAPQQGNTNHHPQQQIQSNQQGMAERPEDQAAVDAAQARNTSQTVQQQVVPNPQGMVQPPGSYGLPYDSIRLMSIDAQVRAVAQADAPFYESPYGQGPGANPQSGTGQSAASLYNPQPGGYPVFGIGQNVAPIAQNFGGRSSSQAYGASNMAFAQAPANASSQQGGLYGSSFAPGLPGVGMMSLAQPYGAGSIPVSQVLSSPAVQQGGARRPSAPGTARSRASSTKGSASGLNMRMAPSSQAVGSHNLPVRQDPGGPSSKQSGAGPSIISGAQRSLTMQSKPAQSSPLRTVSNAKDAGEVVNPSAARTGPAASKRTRSNTLVRDELLVTASPKRAKTGAENETTLPSGLPAEISRYPGAPAPGIDLFSRQNTMAELQGFATAASETQAGRSQQVREHLAIPGGKLEKAIAIASDSEIANIREAIHEAATYATAIGRAEAANPGFSATMPTSGPVAFQNGGVVMQSSSPEFLSTLPTLSPVVLNKDTDAQSYDEAGDEKGGDN